MATKASAAPYKYQFVSEPDDALKCLICLEVAEEPWQHGKCGRLYCKKCLERHGKNKPCPNCRREQPQYLEDGKSEREIKALGVKCDNVERKCEWVGTVGTLEKHVATCKFSVVPCPKRCRVKRLMRKDLDEHLLKSCPNRDYTCQYCGAKGTYAHITEIHDKKCTKKEIRCYNKDCTVTVARENMENHLAKCEHTVIPCKYRKLGCLKAMKRKDMPAHEEGDDKLHLHMALENAIKSKDHAITFKTNYTYGLCLHTSPSFYTSPNGYYMSIDVKCLDRKNLISNPYAYVIPIIPVLFPTPDIIISLTINILEGKHDDELDWPLVGKLTITLLNQLEDKNHLEKIINLEERHNLRVKDHHELHEIFEISDWKKQYINDTFYFRVLFETKADKPWLQCIKLH